MIIANIELTQIKDKHHKMSHSQSIEVQNGQPVKSPYRANIDEEGIRLLAERLYGISVLDIKEIHTLHDRNFRIQEDLNMKNPLIETRSPHGYMFKILNSNDSQDLAFVEAQNEVLNFLHSQSVKCPKPIRNVYGHYFSKENISGKSHVVRLLEFQPGELVKNVPKSEFLFYQVGEYVAHLDRVIKSFTHSGLQEHKSIGTLESFPDTKDTLNNIKDEEKLQIAEDALAEFNEIVVPALCKLDTGVIHGDLNDQNILVNLHDKTKKNDWRVTAILDFGAMHRSCYIFELTIAMANMIMSSGDLNTGGHVLAGYSINRVVPEIEYGLLKTCVSARIVQALVLDGIYHGVQEQESPFQKTGWDLLRKIRFMTDEDLNETWKNIAEDYLTRSNK